MVDFIVRNTDEGLVLKNRKNNVLAKEIVIDKNTRVYRKTMLGVLYYLICFN